MAELPAAVSGGQGEAGGDRGRLPGPGEDRDRGRLPVLGQVSQVKITDRFWGQKKNADDFWRHGEACGGRGRLLGLKDLDEVEIVGNLAIWRL